MLNLIYDISCTAIPWDNVDKEFIEKPKKWDASSIGKFMIWIGPTSSIFDITTYLLSYFFICPIFVPGADGRTFNFIPVSEVAVRSIYCYTIYILWKNDWFVSISKCIFLLASCNYNSLYAYYYCYEKNLYKAIW